LLALDEPPILLSSKVVGYLCQQLCALGEYCEICEVVSAIVH
jgi:hypothetical protein